MERLQRPPHAQQRGVPGQLDDTTVEGRVRDRDGVAIACTCGPLHLFAEGDEIGEVGVGDPGNREPGAERLELRADDVRLHQLAPGRPADPGATERGDLDEPERLEATQRLANRRLARAVLPRHAGLDDPGVGRIAPGEDGLEETVLDLVCEDLAGDGPVFCHDGSCGLRGFGLRERAPLASRRSSRVRERAGGTRPGDRSTGRMPPPGARGEESGDAASSAGAASAQL
jgi:hypothetical protein